jgi:hypothetical protein
MITAAEMFERARDLVVPVYCDETDRARCMRLREERNALLRLPEVSRPPARELWAGMLVEMAETCLAWAQRDGGGLEPGHGAIARAALRLVLGEGPAAHERLRSHFGPSQIDTLRAIFTECARVSARASAA